MQQANYPQHTKCLLSGSEDLKPLKGYEDHYLVKSKPLGFVFCSRIPTEEELQAHYAQYSRVEYYSPITKKRYQQLLHEWEPYRKTNKILDIGCGTGFFLETAKEKGWEVYGTEYTTNAMEICKAKGINMQQGRLKAEWYAPEMFDIVTSFEVLEHINNPVEEVKNINTILRKRGLFYLTTPNFNAAERLILKDKYNVIEYPEHLCYYTPKTLNYLLSHNGFRKVQIMTTGISLSRIKASMGKGQEDKAQPCEQVLSAGNTDEKWRRRIEANDLIKLGKNLINLVLDIFHVGNSLKAWYVKV